LLTEDDQVCDGLDGVGKRRHGLGENGFIGGQLLTVTQAGSESISISRTVLLSFDLLIPVPYCCLGDLPPRSPRPGLPPCGKSPGNGSKNG
jgi:hypothetical protein